MQVFELMRHSAVGVGMPDPWPRELECAGYTLIETHISRVFMKGADVYKTKRAVALGFLDFTSLEARARACHAEVELNRRLAPDVYLSVVALARTVEGALRFAPDGDLAGAAVLEWAVHMRRLSDDDRADVLLSHGRLGAEQVRRIAEMLAQFHACVRSDATTAGFGHPDIIAQNVEENFTQLRDVIAAFVSPEALEALACAQRAFLREQRPRLTQRACAGFARDGHGDLRLEHLYRTPSGSFLAIDCIEFNERFRFADVCADLAFLTMDLAAHGRADLAELLAAFYAEQTSDFELYALLDFYQSYRALVRAKVAVMLANDPAVTQAARDRGASEVRRHFEVARAAAQAPDARPRLIVTFGLIASGKSTLASGLRERLHVPVVSTDRIRKHLLGVAPTAQRREAAFAGAYDAELTAGVYTALTEQAEHVLRSGRSVVVDGSFRGRAERERMTKLAGRLGIDVTFVECGCAPSTAARRLAERAQSPSVSDGRAEIYDAFAASYEPPDELPRARHLRLDTNRALTETLEEAVRALI